MRKSFLCIFIVVCLLLASCGNAGGALKYKEASTTEYFNTTSKLALWGNFGVADKQFTSIWNEAKEILAKTERLLAANIPTSDVARYNALESGGSIIIDDFTAQVITICKQMYTATNGAYDPTVYPCLELWGLTPRFFAYDYTPQYPYDRARTAYTSQTPNQEYMQAFASLIGFDKVTLDGVKGSYRLTKNQPDVTVNNVTYSQQIDLGGVGKGYAVDLISDLLQQNGCLYGYFSCGTSSLSILNKYDDGEAVPYRVALRSPRYAAVNDTFISLPVSNVNMSSSGDYERYHTINGVKYSHLIDPATGRPINEPKNGVTKGICSVSVVGLTAAQSDCLTTALCAMGLHRALEYLNGENSNGTKLRFVLTLFDDGGDNCEIVTNVADSITWQEGFLEEGYYRIASVMTGNKVTYTGTIFAD